MRGIKEPMVLPPHPEVVAALLIIQIIIKSPLLTVFKQDAHQTGAAGNARRHFFHHSAKAPTVRIEGGSLGLPSGETSAFLK